MHLVLAGKRLYSSIFFTLPSFPGKVTASGYDKEKSIFVRIQAWIFSTRNYNIYFKTIIFYQSPLSPY
jgi:hypothetical protein